MRGWRAQARREAGVPVEMRFIDMFMAALGALLFMAMAFSLLLLLAHPSDRPPPPSAPGVDPLRILNDMVLPTGTVDAPYEVQLAADGGFPSYRWQKGSPWPDSSAGPLQLTEDGRLRTTFFPAPGTHEINVLVLDKKGERVAKTFSLSARPAGGPQAPISPPKVHVETRGLPDALLGKPYELALAASGGRGPFRWSIVGDLPLGLRLSDGRLVGTPEKLASALAITLRVADAQIPPDRAEKEILLSVVHGSSIKSAWRYFLSVGILVMYLWSKRLSDRRYVKHRQALIDGGLTLIIDSDGTRFGGPASIRARFQDLNQRETRRVRWIGAVHLAAAAALLAYLTYDPRAIPAPGTGGATGVAPPTNSAAPAKK